jgi:hypothetical protein
MLSGGYAGVALAQVSATSAARVGILNGAQTPIETPTRGQASTDPLREGGRRAALRAREDPRAFVGMPHWIELGKHSRETRPLVEVECVCV